MEAHFQVLGWLMIASAAFTGIGAVVLFVVGGFVQGGPLRLPAPGLGPEAETLIAALISALGVLLAITTVLSAVAGIGILQYQAWGRTVGLIAASLLLTKIPVGTAIGVYAFWVLLSVEGRAHFQARSSVRVVGSTA